MSGTTIISPNAVDTTLLEDGQAAGAITPSDVRQMNDSLAAIYPTQQAASYTFAAADRGTCVEYTGSSAGTFTIPPNSSVAFPVGVLIGFRMYGTGQLTIAAGSGVTLVTPSTLPALVQYSTGFIHQRATNVWVMS